jgi:hypothetical protein
VLVTDSILVWIYGEGYGLRSWIEIMILCRFLMLVSGDWKLVLLMDRWVCDWNWLIVVLMTSVWDCDGLNMLVCGWIFVAGFELFAL